MLAGKIKTAAIHGFCQCYVTYRRALEDDTAQIDGGYRMVWPNRQPRAFPSRAKGQGGEDGMQHRPEQRKGASSHWGSILWNPGSFSLLWLMKS